MKMVHSQPVAKPGRSFGPELWGKASSAAHWRPGSVLFPQQGSCHLLLHDGTVPCTGPGTRRVSVKASTRCRPNEARKAFSHFRLASAAVPENSPPTLHSRTCPVGGAVVKDRPQLTYEQANSGGGGITVCELPTGGHHTLRTEGVQNSHPPTVWREAEVSEINSPAAWPPAAHAGPLSPPPLPGPAAGVGLGARGQGGGKMSEHCCRMSSTTWFWNTMVMGMLASSVSGRSSVGPKTMATFCTDMRFRSPCSITLHGSDGIGLRSQSWEEEGLGPLRPACPFPRSCPRSPAQMLKERPQRVVIGGGQRAHQVPHTAETLGRILQLWARDRSEGGGGETGR